MYVGNRTDVLGYKTAALSSHSPQPAAHGTECTQSPAAAPVGVKAARRRPGPRTPGLGLGGPWHASNPRTRVDIVCRVHTCTDLYTQDRKRSEETYMYKLADGSVPSPDLTSSS